MSFFAKLKLKKLQKQITALCKARQHNPVPDVELKKEILLHLEVAKFYDQRFFNKKFPHAEDLAQESYRAAADLGDTGSQYILGKRLLEKA
ncbi:MAG: hypothetical protein JSS53_09820, partial [Proteobacteria bacterium]|nr:hypothetical protein [Pseudomonadota bacterium]